MVTIMLLHDSSKIISFTDDTRISKQMSNTDNCNSMLKKKREILRPFSYNSDKMFTENAYFISKNRQ